MRLAASAIVIVLSGCATLPAKETEAFKTLAAADRDAFTATAGSERDSVAALAVDHLVAGKGSLTQSGCNPADKTPCVITYSDGARTYPLSVQAPQSARLISAIAHYADAMAELAAAKDLITLNGKIDGVATAVAALSVATAAVAPLAPLTKLIAQGLKGSFAAKRRNLLLLAAEQAKDPIDKAATILSTQTVALKRSIIASAGPRLSTATLSGAQLGDQIRTTSTSMSRLGTSPVEEAERQRLTGLLAVLQQRMGELVRDEYTAAAQMNTARAISADFSSLKKGHDAIITSLRAAKPDSEESIKQFREFAGNLKDLKAAL